jgi:N-terminal acetyltransferase B complex catalytic subunit
MFCLLLIGFVSRYNGYFVDLFVRVSNSLAINMYKNFGYSVYRQVIGYYSGEEDAYGNILP